jgi:ribosome maturation factor RimP
MISLEHQKLIYDVVNHISQSKGLELVELKIGGRINDVMIQVLADRPQGGIGIKECTDLNRSIVEAIDKEAFFSEVGYSLEVSSPGLDRPLMTSKDFLRNLNAPVRILLKEKIAGKGEQEGVVKSVTEHDVTLLTTKEQKEIIVPIDQILKGLLVI